METRPHILILAAGQGKRMHSELPKVLHPVLYRPMIHYVLDLAASTPNSSISLIVGHGEDQVRSACTDYTGVQYFRQDKQLGTGHAVSMAKDTLKAEGGHILILSGDVVLLQRHSIDDLVNQHVRTKASATVLTAKQNSPKGYGRIIRGQKGEFLDIREEADCANDEERALSEVNAGIYLFDGAHFWEALSKLGTGNKQGEFYLTDVIALLRKGGHLVQTSALKDPSEMMGINDRMALVDVESRLRAYINLDWMKRGVTIEDPRGTWIDPTTKLGQDVRIESGCRLVGCEIGDGVTIESGSRILRSRIEPQTVIKQGTYIEDSSIGERCQVGPYAHLRPHSELASEVKIGNFVEVKKSSFGHGSKASHLSYIGDATIGRDVNLGCGFITCNFDGGSVKHRTTIEDGAFIGSDSQYVAPVTVGKGAYVASGSTITKNVPADALAVARSSQDNKLGYAARIRRRKNK